MNTYATFFIAMAAQLACAAIYIPLKGKAFATRMDEPPISRWQDVDWRKNWMLAAHLAGWVGLVVYHAFALFRWAVGG